MNPKKLLSMTPDYKKKPFLPDKSMMLNPFSILRKKLIKHYIPKENSSVTSISGSPSFSSYNKKRTHIKPTLQQKQKTIDANKSLQSSPHRITLKLSANKEDSFNSIGEATDVKFKPQMTYYRINHKLNPLANAFSITIREKYSMLVRGSNMKN
ncbi:hypothetical protein SteCoe_30567 [Stentor coeruleus]|uniref:Uncharacterized protein n=1 Tax=Stentor coeruleus TaxID=5963 RepID=A0A1R2B3D6_9CILI|nr:hypothetical protein SteCoe_30567 [Stentor coeruleus]